MNMEHAPMAFANATRRGKGLIVQRAALSAKTEAHQTKIAPLATALPTGQGIIAKHAPILGQGITAKRAILPAKTAEQQTKNAPLATALPTGQGIIVMYVIFRRQIAALNNISILSIACAFVERKAIRDIIAPIPAHRQQEAFRDCQNLPVRRAVMNISG